MAGLTTSMKAAIMILLLLGIPLNLFRNLDIMDVGAITITAEIAALTFIFVILMWKRSKWGLVGSVILVVLGMMIFSFWNIIDILTGSIEPPLTLVYTESISLALGTLFLFLVFKAYRE